MPQVAIEQHGNEDITDIAVWLGAPNAAGSIRVFVGSCSRLTPRQITLLTSRWGMILQEIVDRGIALTSDIALQAWCAANCQWNLVSWRATAEMRDKIAKMIGADTLREIYETA